MDFDLLGADTDAAISSQYITFRITRLDRERLKSRLGTSGPLASAGVMLASAEPKAALDVAKPIIKSKMKDYGIDAEITVSNVPPSKGGRAVSEFFPGVAVGFALGASCLAIAKLLARIVGL